MRGLAKLCIESELAALKEPVIDGCNQLSKIRDIQRRLEGCVKAGQNSMNELLRPIK